MNAAEAHAAAAAEGLVLEPAKNSSGFKGVSYMKDSRSKPFYAQVHRPGTCRTRVKYLGVFATAEEAALTVARFLCNRIR